jgi:hypothetical protein
MFFLAIETFTKNIETVRMRNRFFIGPDFMDFEIGKREGSATKLLALPGYF